MMRFTFVALLISMATGCATVHPWQRETLSHPCMQLTPQLGDTFGSHMLPIREGATGGEGGLGGGCGCG